MRVKKTKWGYLMSHGEGGKDPQKHLKELSEFELLIAQIKEGARIIRRKGGRGKSWLESALENKRKQEDAMRSSVTLGAEYRDRITGFKGVCTGFCEYISGCNQALLIPRMGKDGKSPDGGWYDVQRLERAGKKIVKLDNSETPGCDMAAPIR